MFKRGEKNYVLLLTCFTLSVAKGQIVNIERARMQSDTTGWMGTAGTSFSLSQNIFPTLFSAKDYLSYKSVQLAYDKLALQNKLDQFEVQKNIIDLYWKIKAIQVSVAENDFLMKKYDSLVKTIQRRKRNSTANAGELEQALAEYELRKQSLNGMCDCSM